MLETLVRHLSMVRLTVISALVFTMGCTGIIGGGDPGETPAQAAARQYFESQVYPVLEVASCVTCHAGMPGVDFLAGAPDPRAAYLTVRNFEPAVLNTDAPESSRIITKGPHSGPALQPSEAAVLLQWANLEVDALPEDPDRIAYETVPIVPLICSAGEPGTATCPINTIDLTSIGAPGSSVTFIVEPLSTGLYLSELKLVAGPEGVYVDHPLFVSWPMPMVKAPDDIDRFFATKMNLMANETLPIDGGTAAFMTFGRQNPISVTFKELDKYRVPGGGPGDPGGGGGGGCKVVDGFTAIAQPQLAAKCAGPCHDGGNPNARNAVDMSLLADTANAMSQQTACNEILTRVNKLDIPNSGILLAPDPSSGTGHPFKDPDFVNFRDNAIIPWATMERDAP
jgi:hypothetical protein